MILDDEPGRLGRRVGYDAYEAAGPDGIAFVGFVVRLEREVPQLVDAGNLRAEGLLGAEDGAAHVRLFDGAVVEDEVEAGGGVGDAVGYHRVGGGGVEDGGCGRGERRRRAQTRTGLVYAPGACKWSAYPAGTSLPSGLVPKASRLETDVSSVAGAASAGRVHRRQQRRSATIRAIVVLCRVSFSLITYNPR